MKFGVVSKSSYLYDFEKKSIDNLLTIKDTDLEIIIQPRQRETKLLPWKTIFGESKSLKPQDITKTYDAPTLEWDTTNLHKEIQVLNQKKLDFILNFNDFFNTTPIIKIPRHGVWEIRHGQLDQPTFRTPGIWEIYHDEKLTQVSLIKLHEPEKCTVLRRGVLKNIDYSLSRNIDKINYQTIIWPKQVAGELSRSFEAFKNKPPETLNNQRSKQTKLNTIILSSKLLKNAIREVFTPTRQWNIGVIDKPISSLLSDEDYEIKWFPRPPNHLFIADPFGAEINSKKIIYVEEYHFREQKGIISALEINDKMNPIHSQNTLEKEYHLSYPYIFHYEDEVYVIPESYNNKEITLYKILDPSKWEKISTIIPNIDAIDPSITEFNGKWWLFFTRQQTDSDTNLYIYHADDPLGEWIPHSNNPVKSDIRSSRPGGSMFIHEGDLYRPTQNCSMIYGGSIMINKVTKLTVDEFDEHIAKEIKLPGNWTGTHTLSTLGDKTLIDGAKTPPRNITWYNNRIRSILRYLLS